MDLWQYYAQWASGTGVIMVRSPVDEASLENLAILTATPDLLAQGLLPDLLERLLESGIHPRAAMPLCFTSPMAAELYGGRVTHDRKESRLHSTWLNPRLFLAGPSLILFLQGDPPRDALVEVVRNLKGGSRLGERRPHHLRNISPLTDRGFSLVHSPDDADGLLHELRLVLGDRAIEELLAPERAPLNPSHVVQILPFAPIAAAKHPFDVLPRVVAQVAACCATAPRNRELAKHATTLLEATRQCLERLSGCPIDRALQSALWERMAALNEQIRTLGAAQRRQVDWSLHPVDLRPALRLSELLCSLASVCCEERFTPCECEILLQGLQACHLVPAPWDAHRLRLIAAYHRSSSLGSG